MADATAPRTRHEDPLVLGEGLSREAITSIAPARVPAAAPAVPAPAMLRALALLWLAFVASLTGFLAFGSVRVGAGKWIGLRLDVRRIWSRFIDFLVDEGASAAIVLGVTAVAAVSLFGAAFVLWLAFALKDSPIDHSTGDAAER